MRWIGRLLSRLGHEFAPETAHWRAKDKASTPGRVPATDRELPLPAGDQELASAGESALKAVQLRLDQNSSDPIFATVRWQNPPAPSNRWVGKLADQARHVVMVEAVRYMEVDWRDNVVKPFNERLPITIRLIRAPHRCLTDSFERFFKPDGILDNFYKNNLRLFLENDLTFGDDGRVLIREDIRQQLDTAQKIRDIFFSQQNGLGAQFAVETVSLSGNKRRSVLNPTAS